MSQHRAFVMLTPIQIAKLENIIDFARIKFKKNSAAACDCNRVAGFAAGAGLTLIVIFGK